MTLNRSLFRNAIVMAASNYYEPDPDYPTLAGPNIYDSKIEPNETMESKMAVPIAVVYTDYDKDFPTYRDLSTKPRSMTLTIEFIVVQATETTPAGAGPDGREFTLETPFTDAELEITLDNFERQFFRSFNRENPAAECVRMMMMSVSNVISRRGSSIDGGTRLAARQLTMEVDIPRDPQPGVIPQYAQAFLDSLEDRGGLDPGVVAALRQGYLETDTRAFTSPTPKLEALPSVVADALGLTRRGAPVLITPIQWLNPDGTPVS